MYSHGRISSTRTTVGKQNMLNDKAVKNERMSTVTPRGTFTPNRDRSSGSIRQTTPIQRSTTQMQRGASRQSTGSVSRSAGSMKSSSGSMSRGSKGGNSGGNRSGGGHFGGKR